MQRSSHRPMGAARAVSSGLLEVGVAAALLAITVLLQAYYPMAWWAFALGCLGCVGAALAAWRLRVGTVFTMAMVLAQALLPPSLVGVGFHAGLLPLFTATRQGRTATARAATATYAVVVAIMVLRTVSHPGGVLPYLVVWTFLFALVCCSGSLVHRSTQRHRAAMTGQRQAFARHLHDTVAHDLSVIVMTAQRAQLTGGASPEDLSSIIRTAQQSITSLRAFMDTLQLTGSAAADALDPIAPLPQVLADRTKDLQRHGFRVTNSQEGDLTHLPQGVDACLARIAREALNNVMRHGDPGTPVLVMSETTPDAATLLVVNQAAVRTSGPARQHAPRGLTGMRSHIQALGGTLEVGPHNQQWSLRATCPLRPPRQEETA